MAQLLGSDFYAAVTSLLNGFQMNQTIFYQYLNTARIQREMLRPFKRLEKLDMSQQAQPVSTNPVILNSQQKFTIPSDFLFLKEDGFITLYNSNNVWQSYYEISYSLSVYYLQIANKFYMDHGNMNYYLTGIIDQLYTVFMFYQADWGDIAPTTTWTNIPGIFHMILAFDVASMYRLGQDYDDISARNAESNHQQAELLYKMMCTWDDNLQRSAVTQMDYPTVNDSPEFQNKKINMG